MGWRRKNLILVANVAANHRPDFEKVAQHVQEIDPSILPTIMGDWHMRSRRWLLAARPTMAFAPVQTKKLNLLRGRLFQGNPLSKAEEYDALAAAGVPVPRYAVLSEHETPDLSAFTPYVVVKPNRGGRGAKIRIMRKSRVKWEPMPNTVAGDSDEMIVQDFVYTGQWPTSYRVTTLFGQTLWSLKVEASHERTPLPGPEAFKDAPGVTVVSNSKNCVMCLNHDEEVIRFAETAHKAFPDIPLLGVDVIREQPSGKLYVVEVNASGWVWHFSSPMGLRAQETFGFRFEDQFDGLRKAARVLVEQAHKSAC